MKISAARRARARAKRGEEAKAVRIFRNYRAGLN